MNIDNIESSPAENSEGESIAERLNKLSKKISEMHGTYHNYILPIHSRKEELWQKSRPKLEAIVSNEPNKGSWNTSVEEFMIPEDAVEYRALSQQQENFGKNVTELMAEVVLTLRDAGQEVRWTKRSEIPKDRTGRLESESFDTYLGDSQVHLVTDDSESRRNGLSNHSLRLFRMEDNVSFPAHSIFVFGKKEGGYTVDGETAQALDTEEQEKVIQGMLELVKQARGAI
jgi:hypothetical protein